jgi:protein subunit release factor B
MAVSPEKQKELQERMERLGIQDKDILEKFVLGSGKGGQKINKTASCVYLKHLPTGIEIKCQKDRSRELNRFLARRQLCEQLEEKVHGIKSAKQIMIEKQQKQKKRRERRRKNQINDTDS